MFRQKWLNLFVLTGTAQVFEHQIPGGQYSNLMVQCKSMGLWTQWNKVLDTYRDVNKMFGDIIKVTPSSKVVGDMVRYSVAILAIRPLTRFRTSSCSRLCRCYIRCCVYFPGSVHDQRAPDSGGRCTAR